MTSLKRRFFEGASDLLIALFGLNRPIRLYRAFFDRINAVKPVEINGTRMLFDANAELHLLRAEWLRDKEPETLAWIDTFGEGEVFYDIGANVGVFSVYAALRRKCSVLAFEPEAKNYACLNRNIFLNQIASRVSALNVGLHDCTAIERLYLDTLGSGAALHGLGAASNWRKRSFEAKFEQAVLAFSLDDLVERFALPVPHHVKLDVDGNEARIVRGGRRTLSGAYLKSIQVELNENDSDLISLIESCGLRLAQKTHAGLQGDYADMYNAEFRRS